MQPLLNSQARLHKPSRLQQKPLRAPQLIRQQIRLPPHHSLKVSRSRRVRALPMPQQARCLPKTPMLQLRLKQPSCRRPAQVHKLPPPPHRQVPPTQRQALTRHLRVSWRAECRKSQRQPLKRLPRRPRPPQSLQRTPQHHRQWSLQPLPQLHLQARKVRQRSSTPSTRHGTQHSRIPPLRRHGPTRWMAKWSLASIRRATGPKSRQVPLRAASSTWAHGAPQAGSSRATQVVATSIRCSRLERSLGKATPLRT